METLRQPIIRPPDFPIHRSNWNKISLYEFEKKNGRLFFSLLSWDHASFTPHFLSLFLAFFLPHQDFGAIFGNSSSAGKEWLWQRCL